MNRFAQLTEKNHERMPAARKTARISLIGFFLRYPIFLLAFGPPVFRRMGIDVTSGQIDIWSVFQVGLIVAVGSVACYRLASAGTIFIPKRIQSILRIAFFVGLLFFASALYSPSRFASAAYAIFYLLTIVCMTEFIAGVYRNPPDWMHIVFRIRFIALLLYGLAIVTLAVSPTFVLSPEAITGIRFSGGAVAPTTVMCPIIAIISISSFLHNLESRYFSAFFSLVGIAGTILTQARGTEFAFLVALAFVVLGSRRDNRRSAYVFIAGTLSFLVLSIAYLWVIGFERLWFVINRGQNIEGIKSASGRTELWKFVINYCISHPWGMGYVAGFRILFRQYFSLTSGRTLSQIGSAHSTYMDTLAGAGWLAFALYLILLIKVFLLYRSFAAKRRLASSVKDRAAHDALQCVFALLVFCMTCGISATEFSAPLRAGFYCLYIFIAVILGICATMTAMLRRNAISSQEYSPRSESPMNEEGR